MVLVQVLEHMRRQTSWQLSKMKREDKFADVDWKMLNEYLPEKLLEELDEEQNTTIHRQLSTDPDFSSNTPRNVTTGIELLTAPTINQTDSISNTSILRRERSAHDDLILPVIELRDTDNEQRQNIRNALTTRFLTAMSIDYEKQWYLGMIRRQSLDILIKSVEEAKQKCSLKLHWQLIVEHFHLSVVLLNLMRFDYFDLINKWTNKLLFNHIFLTIELTLGFHSAKTRIDNIRFQFPELANIDEPVLNEVCEEVKMYQQHALHVLFDLQQSYHLCWTIQMTKRCAQMLLKYESIAIIQLYETGMLDESEYSHILELIENKLFALEYGNIQMPVGQMKIIENGFDLLSIFQRLSDIERTTWRSVMKPRHKWFQPGMILLEEHRPVTTAYLIVRGIVERKEGNMPTYYKSGNIVGIDALFTRNSSTHGTYIVSGGLVEAYAIDSNLLNIFLADEKVSRSMYNEITLQVLINKYRTHLKLNHSQLKLLLDEKARFYRNQSDLSICLEANERLFILKGNLLRRSDDADILVDSIQLVVFDVPAIFKLNSSSIAFTWTDDDELYCLTVTKFQVNFPATTYDSASIEPFYPDYSGDTIEFTPRRHSTQMTRPVENLNSLQFIPSEIEVNTEHNI